MKRLFAINFLLVCAYFCCVNTVFASEELPRIYHVPAYSDTLQEAIDAASDGDTIIVAPGIFNENINMSGKAITLTSENPDDRQIVDATIIDGGQNGSVITCNSGEGPDTIIQGITITNGKASHGGGIVNENKSSPKIVNCVLIENTADRIGGGIYNGILSSPQILNCTFQNNSAQLGIDIGNGGGAYPVIEGCTFDVGSKIHYAKVHNVPVDFNTIQEAIDAAFDGDIVKLVAGIYHQKINMKGKAITLTSSRPDDPQYVSITVIDGGQNGSVITCNSSEGPDTIIQGITITNGSGTGEQGNTFGGGMYIESSSPTISNCIFDRNTADSGGGMYNKTSSPAVTSCTFSSNTSTNGGGMANLWYSDPTISNCNFIGNTATNGGGMSNRFGSSATVSNCKFSGNTAEIGGGIYSGSTPIYPSISILTDTVFCGNQPNSVTGIFEGSYVVNNDCVLVKGDLTGDGKVDVHDLAVLAANWLR